MQPQDSQNGSKSAKGYGKRPLWQWIVIYVVLAIVVYGIAFVVYKHYHSNGSSTGGSGSSSLY